MSIFVYNYFTMINFNSTPNLAWKIDIKRYLNDDLPFYSYRINGKPIWYYYNIFYKINNNFY